MHLSMLYIFKIQYRSWNRYWAGLNTPPLPKICTWYSSFIFTRYCNTICQLRPLLPNTDHSKPTKRCPIAIIYKSIKRIINNPIPRIQVLNLSRHEARMSAVFILKEHVSISKKYKLQHGIITNDIFSSLISYPCGSNTSFLYSNLDLPLTW